MYVWLLIQSHAISWNLVASSHLFLLIQEQYVEPMSNVFLTESSEFNQTVK